jgi:septal ring factor EnvC (AmiA/AmiB activator)
MVRGSLEQRHSQIAKLLAALQRMGRNPPPVMITQREDALQMVRSAMLLASAFPEMRSQALELSGKLEELTRVMGDIRKEGDKLKTETTRLTDMRTRLAGLMATKKQSISERQAELARVRVAAAEISKNVDDLSDLISKLDEAVTNNTGLGAYERQIKETPRSDSAAQPSTASPAGGSIKPAEVALLPPPKTPDPSVIELAPSSKSLVPGNPVRIEPAIAFNLAKSKLPMPVQGRRVLSFGEKTQFGGSSKGIVLETRSNAQVTSPCDGWVVYAGEFRSYGQLLIINAGGGYHVLIAGLSQIDVQPGQFVIAAEPVGTMSGAAAPAPEGAASSAPVLYVEFRKDGQPIDPDPWWVADTQKVQG